MKVSDKGKVSAVAINDEDLLLTHLQKEVGGLIELALWNDDYVVYVNEEGLIQNKSENILIGIWLERRGVNIPYVGIRGNAVILGPNESSLDEEICKKLAKELHEI